MSRHLRRRSALLLGLVLAAPVGVAACSGDDDGAGADTGGPTSTAVAAAPATSSTTTASAAAMIRDGDVLDPAELGARMGEEAGGDRPWIDVMADLRARSWLATRYPGRYDLADIYALGLAEDTTQSLELGVYIDEPLPLLITVEQTRELGALVELEVVLETGEATIRRESDDVAVQVLPGGVVRGLFTLGPAAPQDPDRPWRIHSIVELTPPDGAGSSDPLEVTE
ncbi:MAG: hypothetical protein AAGD35_21405 [Actinomycetota bacterium]